MRRAQFIVSLLILASVKGGVALACDPLNPQLIVNSNNGRPAPIPPPGTRPPPPPDGSALRPFRNLQDALTAGEAKDYCEIRIKLGNGTYVGEFWAKRSLEILGTDRSTSIIQGGIYSTAGELKLWDLGFENSHFRAISKSNGTFNFNRLTLRGYEFASNFFSSLPAVVELTNTQGTITGMDVSNSEQPALYVSGGTSRVKAFGFSAINMRTSPHADNSQAIPRYAGAVEVADGAILNLLASTLKNVQFEGLYLRNGGQALLGGSEIQAITPSSGFATTIGPDAVGATNGSVLELKNTTLENAGRAGILLVNSWLKASHSVIKNSIYGLVNENAQIDNKNGYVTAQCATLDGTSYAQNQHPIVAPGGDLPIPNQPLPVPCDPHVSACPPPPPPPPAPPPLVCKSVLAL